MRLHFYISKHLSERIEHIGSMLGHAKARAAAFLLDNASQDESQALTAIDERIKTAAATAAGEPAPRGEGERTAEIVLMYVRLTPDVAARLEQLARKKGLSISRVCAWLLSRAAEDDQWIVGVVQDRLTKALAQSTSRENL